MRRSRAGWLSRTTLPGIIIAVILGLVGPSTWTPDGPAGARTADPSGRTSGDSAGMSITAAEVGLTAPLDPIRFEGSTLEPPEQVNRAGWWADGAELAADGDRPSVITGHVSDGRDTPGAFAAVRRLKPDMTAGGGWCQYAGSARTSCPDHCSSPGPVACCG